MISFAIIRPKAEKESGMELAEVVRDVVTKHLERLILSRPQHKEKNPYQKVMVRPILLKGSRYYQIERFTRTQAFHENIPEEELSEKLTALLEDFSQVDGWAKEGTFFIRTSKKGKVLYRPNFPKPTVETLRIHEMEEEEDHDLWMPQNRQKNYLLEAKDAPRPLVDLGVVTKDGKIVHDQYAKFRQINRFVELVSEGIPEDVTSLNILDFGCGKSYLTFVLYDYLTRVRKMTLRMVGLDLKEAVIRHCNEIAGKYGYDGLTFEVGDINGYEPPFPVDMVVSLHACDTATDFALFNAISWNTPYIYSVPCCQHEVNGQLGKDSLGTISQSGLLKERFAAILTDAMRADLLRSQGYQTDVLEFIDMEFSPKNVMLRCQKTSKKQVSEKNRLEALQRVEEAIKTYAIDPTLYRLLHNFAGNPAK